MWGESGMREVQDRGGKGESEDGFQVRRGKRVGRQRGMRKKARERHKREGRERQRRRGSQERREREQDERQRQERKGNELDEVER